MDFVPEDDGITHVNVYSKGKTTLGRLLSNFAYTPFELDGERFASVEGWWYWRKTGNRDVARMHGFAAKQYGRQLPKILFEDPSPGELLRVYQAKVSQNLGVACLLHDNKLPFDHYYVVNGARRSTTHAWTGKLWSQVRP